LRVAVSVPDVVTGVPPIVRVEFASESPTDVTVPVGRAVLQFRSVPDEA
jgi:hypothetical protein